MNNESKAQSGGEEIPEVLENWVSQWLFKHVESAPIDLDEHVRVTTFCRAIVYQAYRFMLATHPPVVEGGLRWVKATDHFPTTEEPDKFMHIKPIREGFDFYMFLKYVQDFDKEGPPSFRWNLWDGHHGWTRKITPELLSKIIWLEEPLNRKCIKATNLK